MKKGLAIAIATGALLGVFASQNPTEAVPMPGQVVAPPQQQVQVVAQQQQQQNPQNGWDVPDLGEKEDAKYSVKPVIGDDGKPVIQVALLLDTSGSMSSLIDQAKTELWSIVNKLGEAKYKGQSPRIEVALYEYGKSSLERDEGESQVAAFLSRTPWARVLPVTADELPAGIAPNPEGFVRTLPGQLAADGGLDGFFMARIARV